MVQGIDEFVEGIMPQYRRQLAELVRIQSISQEPGHANDLMIVAEAVDAIARSIGFTTHYVLPAEVEGLPSPVLVARFEVDPQAPTVMIYNHLDVQPVKRDEWGTDPFEPIDEGSYLIGRGTTDDKGPMLAGLLQFKHLIATKQLPLNVECVYETHEENGSSGFEQALAYALQKGWIVPPDSILASDTIFDGDNSSLTYGLRGLVKAKASLQTAAQGIHSGLGGAVVANPLNILMAALSSCYDARTGEVTFPGIEEGIVELAGPLAESLRKNAATFDRERFLRDLRAGTTYQVGDNADVLTRLWHKPTLELHEVRRMSAKGTVIPYQAEADITLRLAGRQDPARVVEYLERHLKRTHPDIKLEVGGMLHPVATDIENPFMDAAAAACEVGYGRKPSYIASGGSIGAFSATQKLFPHAPTVMLAMSKASDGYHAPNEKFEWAQAKMGMKAIAHYVAGIGNLRTK